MVWYQWIGLSQGILGHYTLNVSDVYFHLYSTIEYGVIRYINMYASVTCIPNTFSCAVCKTNDSKKYRVQQLSYSWNQCQRGLAGRPSFRGGRTIL